MHILFVGYSSIVRKRLLPLMAQLKEITRVSVARFGTRPWDDQTSGLVHQRYDSFEEAERHCQPDLVYVSTVNSAHHGLAKTWLERSCHVIVDKPATLCVADTEELLLIAKARGVLLAEATVYTFHPQLAMVSEIFASAHCVPRYATVHFSFPPLAAENFRYRKDQGGGALFDTAPYAASVGRYFFRDLPTAVFGVCNERTVEGLCVSYSVLLQYPGGRTMVGHFGFTTEYSNRLSLLGECVAVDVDRVFTTPDTCENALIVRRRNTTSLEVCPPANSFKLFFDGVTAAVKQRSFQEFADAMLYDATVTQRLRQQVEGTPV